MLPLRSWHVALVTLSFGLWPRAALASFGDVLVWHNYPAGLQDATYNMSSERNTQVVEATWVVEDVDLTQLPGGEPPGLLLTQLIWIGARHPGYTYSTADVVFLDANRDVVLELTDVAYASVDLDPDPNPDPAVQTYEGAVVFDPPVAAAQLGHHFYVGVRLVGDGYFEGRNHFVTSSIDGTLRGLTEGYVRAEIFGAPDWTPASDVWYGMATPGINFEFAFRLYGQVACLGDLNGDGHIDLSDLGILLANYGLSGGMGYADGDLDGDGDVDLADLTALLAVYGTDC